MMTQLIIKCSRNIPHPEVFRITVADSNGSFVVPLEAEYICCLPDRYKPKWVWSYGKEEVRFLLAPGSYTCIVSAGPAWSIDFRTIQVTEEGNMLVEIPLRRIFNPLEEGWVSGDSHLHTWRGKQKDDFDTVFIGEDIDFAGIQYLGLYSGAEHIEEAPEKGCFKIGNTWASVDEEVEMHSPWGAWEDSTVVGLENKLPDLRKGFGYRMNSMFYKKAREASCKMIVYQAPTWMQFPVDVILGLVDGVNLCDNCYSITMPAYGPWGLPNFDRSHPLQKEPYGMAYWMDSLYYRMLNAGFKLPVSGGSAYPQGGGGGPAGMSRFYVEMDGQPSPEKYFDNWKNGRTFATNGPLLFAQIDGARPGSRVIEANGEKARMSLRVVSNRPVKYLEWIGDGKVIDRRELTALNGPQDEIWEIEHDLRPYHWVAARCFGESERTLMPVGGQISPPFLAAHTSPFYVNGSEASDDVKKAAVSEIAGHINWMRGVVEGTEDRPADPDSLDPKLLSEAEKEEILCTLDRALDMLQNSVNLHY